MCSTYCSAKDTCSDNGTCRDDGTCACDQGWGGSSCSEPHEVDFSGNSCPDNWIQTNYKWKAMTCKGDCSSCSTPNSWSNSPPSCKYKDNRTYRFLKGRKCWGGPRTCIASEDKITHVRCKPVENIYTGESCPAGENIVLRKYASRTCKGDCSTCTTAAGFFSTPPECSFKDNRYYIFLEGDKCWDGASVCDAQEVVAVTCV